MLTGHLNTARLSAKLNRASSQQPPTLRTTRLSSHSCRCRRTVLVLSAKGFGSASGSGKSSSKQPSSSTTAPQKASTPSTTTYTPGGSNNDQGFWSSLKVTKKDLEAKPRLPLILANGKSVLLWLVGDRIFCTAATGTALEFPLVDAVMFLSPQGKHSIRSPLDGTEYDLESGTVLTWCPPEETVFSVRNFLAASKRSAAPVPLPVFKTRIAPSGEIEALFSA